MPFLSLGVLQKQNTIKYNATIVIIFSQRESGNVNLSPGIAAQYLYPRNVYKTGIYLYSSV